MKNGFFLSVLLSLGGGLVVGILLGDTFPALIGLFGLIGDLFMRGLMLVAMPLVFSSIVVGAARLGGEQAFETIGVRTLGIFLSTMVLATLVGAGGALLLIHFTDFSCLPIPAVELPSTPGSFFEKLHQIVLTLVPNNIVAAAGRGELIGVIVFGLLFGYFLPKIDAEPAEVLLKFFQGVFQVMMQITHLLMRLLPIGVFALMAKVAAEAGLAGIKSVGTYFIGETLTLTLWGFVILPLILWGVARLSPTKLINAISPALLTAFTTSSSAATLPMAIESLEKRAGISNRVTSFVYPLGTTLNMTGSALFATFSALFLLSCSGQPFNAVNCGIVILMGFLTAFGMAGIPSGGIVAMMVILKAVDVPLEMIGLLLPVERLLDMIRTAINCMGISSSTALVAHFQKEPLPNLRRQG